MLTTRFTDLVGCRVPLQQAGMGGVATAELAVAVTQAGALGMIGGVRLPASFLAGVLDQVRRQTSSPVGVNFLMPFLDLACVEVAATRARVVEFFYADPRADLIRRIHQGGALAAWQVGSVEEARAAADVGCDFYDTQSNYRRLARSSIGSSRCSSRSSTTRCRCGVTPARPTCGRPSLTDSIATAAGLCRKVTTNHG